MNQPLILVDGTAFLFRSYFSTISQNLTNESGFPTGAMFGVVNAVKHLQRKYQGAKLIMIFDAKGTNFRHEIFPEYKANRSPAHDDLIVQIEPLYKIIRAMGFHFLCEDDVEADDVLPPYQNLQMIKVLKLSLPVATKISFSLWEKMSNN